MQDLVGCRAIVDTIDDLKEVMTRYKSVSEGGRVRRTNDYIANPKASGYRCVHLILKFEGLNTGEKHAGCNVEIQLRTKLQHVWGTTVEAVGSMRNEDLKAGEGNPQWLRFLTLMSGHIAELEGQPLGEHLPMSYRDLKDEAKSLSSSLSVRHNLSTFNEFMHEADEYGGYHGSAYMLRMDAVTGNVRVSPRWRELFAFDDLDDDFEETKQSIEVSVDNMAALRQAYPNYFADTREFLKILEDMEGPRPKRAKRANNSIDALDLSFLPKEPLAPKKAKVLFLEYGGNVYWDTELVGRWETGFYGEHYFSPGGESYFAFKSMNLKTFKADLKDWLENS